VNVMHRLSRYCFTYHGLTTAAILALACVTSLLAPTAAQAQTNVALVDIGKIFKSHPVFGQQLEGLRQEAEQFKAQTQQMQQALQQEALGLREGQRQYCLSHKSERHYSGNCWSNRQNLCCQ